MDRGIEKEKQDAERKQKEKKVKAKARGGYIISSISVYVAARVCGGLKSPLLVAESPACDQHMLFGAPVPARCGQSWAARSE